MSTAIPVTFEPGSYVSSTNAEGFFEGRSYGYLDREYRFAKNAADASGTVGQIAEMASVTSGVLLVTPAGQTSSLGRVPVGIFRTTVPVNNWCFLQTRGKTQTTGVAVSAAAPAIGNVIVSDGATVVGTCKVAAAVTDKPVGTAIATKSGGFVLAELSM